MSSISEGDSIWAVLGLEATTDTAAIRRAYRARLREIDIDRDTGSFIALRQAFEYALQWSPGDAEGHPDESEEPADGEYTDFASDPETPSDGADSECGADDALGAGQFHTNSQDRMLIEAFDRAVEERKVAEAEPIFNAIMARGIAGIGDESEYIRRFVSIAVEDISFPTARLEDLAGRFIAQGFNGRSDGFESLRADVLKRVEADTWHTTLRRNANESWRPFGRNRRIRRVARLLLKRRWQSVFLRVHGVTLDQALVQYHQHSGWIGAGMDSHWIAGIERRRKRQIRRTNFLILTFLALLAVDFVYVVGRALVTGDWK